MMNKAQKTFQKIAAYAANMACFAALMTLEENEKKRDRMMVKIMELNEKIEEQYATNWH